MVRGKSQLRRAWRRALAGTPCSRSSATTNQPASVQSVLSCPETSGLHSHRISEEDRPGASESHLENVLWGMLGSPFVVQHGQGKGHHMLTFKPDYLGLQPLNPLYASCPRHTRSAPGRRLSHVSGALSAQAGLSYCTRLAFFFNWAYITEL